VDALSSVPEAGEAPGMGYTVQFGAQLRVGPLVKGASGDAGPAQIFEDDEDI
jgi:hypothetical protein